MVSIVVYDTDDIVVKYGLTDVKDLNIQDKYDEDNNTNDYKTNVSLEPLNKDGFVVDETTGITGVKFVSGNSSVIASTGDTAVTALTAVAGASNANVTLYNVVVVVKNSTTNRTYSISTGQQISVSGVSAS